MNSDKFLKHGDFFEHAGIRYQFKLGLPCTECCFSQTDVDGDFLCNVPCGVPYCNDGGFVVCDVDKSRHRVELTDDQVLTVQAALEFYRLSVTDPGLRESVTSSLVVFENI